MNNETTTTKNGKTHMKTIKVSSVTEAEIQAATANLVELRRQMTFLRPMTSTERATNPKVIKNAVQVTQMRVAAAREHRDALPPSFDLRAFEKESALLTALDACLSAVNQLQSELRDTFLSVATGALHSSKVAYGHIQVVAEAGSDIDRSVRNLKLRNRKPKREAAAAAPTPGKSAAPATSASAASPQSSASATATGPTAPPQTPSVSPAAPGDAPASSKAA
jgi:hypothetical protein